MVRELAVALAGKAAVVQINTEENPSLAARFAIRGIPALILLQKGKVLSTLSGARPKDSILAWFREHAS